MIKPYLAFAAAAVLGLAMTLLTYIVTSDINRRAALLKHSGGAHVHMELAK